MQHRSSPVPRRFRGSVWHHERVIELHLRDLGMPLVEAWKREFTGVGAVTVSHGDIFSTKPGQVAAGDPIDVTADAVVSPGNSFGFMDGGIDAVYTYQFGSALQQRLQALIVDEHGGELPVGTAVLVPTLNDAIPWCICAPTMRTPQAVPDSVNAYLALRAALRAVLAHNAAGKPPIIRVLCPGLATSIGRMPVGRCARQMRMAWDRVIGVARTMPRSINAASDDEMELRR